MKCWKALERIKKAKIIIQKIADGTNPTNDLLIETDSFLHDPKYKNNKQKIFASIQFQIAFYNILVLINLRYNFFLGF